MRRKCAGFEGNFCVAAEIPRKEKAASWKRSNCRPITTCALLRVEVECVKQIVQSRSVQRHIRIVLCRLWIGIIVTAASRQRLQLPVALDEFRERNVVAISDGLRGRPCVNGDTMINGIRVPSPKKSSG